MITWIKFFFQICLFKAAPQDAPSSKSVLYVAVIAYFLVALVITLQTQELAQSIVAASIQTGLIIFVTNLVLWIRKTPERYVQTISALMGACALIGVLAIPILNLIINSGGLEGFNFVLWFIFIAWEALVVAHIFRHTMELPFLAGLGMSLIYMYLSFAITLRILRVMTMTVG